MFKDVTNTDWGPIWTHILSGLFRLILIDEGTGAIVWHKRTEPAASHRNAFSYCQIPT